MADEQTSSAKHRSPNYPALSLRESAEKAKLFYEGAKKGKVSPDVAIKIIGLKPSSSSGQRALAALLSFGLLDSEGPKGKKDVWLSELGQNIIFDKDPDSADLVASLQEAVLRPEIHAWARSKWPEGLPAADVAIYSPLTKELKFNPNAAPLVIKEIRASFSYARLSGDEAEEPGLDAGASQSATRTTESPSRTNSPVSKPQITPAGYKDYSFPLAGREPVILRAPDRAMSKRDFDKLTQWISLMEDALTSEGEHDKESDQK